MGLFGTSNKAKKIFANNQMVKDIIDYINENKDSTTVEITEYKVLVKRAGNYDIDIQYKLYDFHSLGYEYLANYKMCYELGKYIKSQLYDSNVWFIEDLTKGTYTFVDQIVSLQDNINGSGYVANYSSDSNGNIIGCNLRKQLSAWPSEQNKTTNYKKW